MGQKVNPVGLRVGGALHQAARDQLVGDLGQGRPVDQGLLAK